MGRKKSDFHTPLFETKIFKAVFINQDIIIYPNRDKAPNNLDKVIKFLFGGGAVATQDCANNCNCIRITGATYVLDNVKTLNAQWEYREVEDV